MPLFRFHRGNLQESLKTTIIVRTFNDMVKAIVNDAEIMRLNPPWGAKFAIAPYPDIEEMLDLRIGWYTQMVTANLYDEHKMHPVGFLSEPFND